MTRIVVDKSTDHAKPHSVCFFTTISTSKKTFFSERELKKALRDTLTRAALSGLFIDNGRLANHIARLVAIVVKLALNENVSRKY